ncbi:hypothetical protein V6Z11_D10G287900 [Gossypium hirsutum]
MGKDIVMQDSEYPGKRSRLWNCKDVEEVISHDKVPSTLNCFVALAVKVWLNFGMKMII